MSRRSCSLTRCGWTNECLRCPLDCMDLESADTGGTGLAVLTSVPCLEVVQREEHPTIRGSRSASTPVISRGAFDDRKPERHAVRGDTPGGQGGRPPRPPSRQCG